MVLPQWWIQALLVFWMVLAGFAYIMGTSPVYGLIGIIFATITIMVRSFVKKPS